MSTPRSDDQIPPAPAPGSASASEAATLPPAAPALPGVAEAETLPLLAAPKADAASEEAVSPAGTEPSGKQAIPGYEIRGELGRGGMGVVYKARQVKLDRVVALKMILAGSHAGEMGLTRFRTEAEAVARLQHPGIVQIYEVGEHNGLPFFSLEFCPGGSLDKKLGGTPQPPREAAALVEKLAVAMEAAHQKGVIHRDLKPANVLLAEDGTPKITDFGLAKKLDAAGQTQTGAVMGTPSYMAPEQAGGSSKQVGPAADVYALGAILYECLTGHPPFKSAVPVDTVLQVLSEEPVPPSRLLPKCPRDLETICLKCLQKEPRKRYASAAGLAEDLRHFLAGEPIRARPVGAPERLWRWCRRNPLVAGLTAATVLFVAVSFLAVAVGYLNTATALKEAREARESEAREKDLARQERDAARGLLYLADLRAAVQAYDRDDLAEARERLDRYRPRPGWADPRGWEWYYLDALMQGHLLTLHGVPPEVRWSADGRLVSPGKVWDAATGVEVAAYPLPAPKDVQGYWLSPDGRRLAAISSDRATLKVWGPAGEELAAVPVRDRGLFEVVWSPDGKRLAGPTRGKTILLWEAVTGMELPSLRGHAGLPGPLDWSADGGRLASGDDQGNVKVWDVVAGKEVRAPADLALGPKQGPGVQRVALSPDGGRVAAAGLNTIKVWDTATGKDLLTLPHGLGGNNPQAMAWSADGKYLAAATQPGLVRLWNARTGGEPASLAWSGAQVQCVAFSPDGKYLAAAQGGRANDVTVWEVDRAGTTPGRLGKPAFTLRGFKGPVSQLTWGPKTSSGRTGRRLLAGSGDGSLKVWETTGVRQVDRTLRGLGFSGLALAWSPDGGRLAVSSDGMVKVWEPDSDSEPVTLKTATDTSAYEMAWSPEMSSGRTGRRLAIPGADKQVHVWDVDAAREVLTLTGHAVAIHAVAWSPDGNRLASGGGNGFKAEPPPEVKVWDAGTGRCLFTFRGHARQVSSVGWSPDGRLLASVGIEGKVKVWEPVGGAVSATLDIGVWPGLGVVQGPALAWGPNAAGGVRRLATTSYDGTCRIWDVSTGKVVRTIQGGRPGATTFLAWTPDGRRLLVPGALHDAETGQELLKVSCSAAAWSPDGRRLALDTHGAVTVWDPVPPRSK
jgi:WD40 repeat protein/tRNA A-37 threonylcarbamoyl transferase component Bud32